MVGNVSWGGDALVEVMEHVEGFGEYKQLLVEGSGASLAAPMFWNVCLTASLSVFVTAIAI